MTTPIAADDIVQGAALMLQACPEILDVLGSFNTVPSAPFLFQHRLRVELEGSQSTAAVVGSDGGWIGANQHNTLRFPRLVLDIYVDPQRDPQGNVTDPDEARRRVDYVFAVFDRRLHRPQGGSQMWGAVRTISSARIIEPSVYAVPDGDGLVRLTVSYAVTQG